MNLNITGKDFDLTDAIRNYISEKVSKLTKYIGDDFDATATLKIEGNEQVAEIRVSFDGEVIKAVTASKDLYSSIDKDIEILEGQIRKTKTKKEKMMREGSLKDMNQTSSEKHEINNEILKYGYYEIKPLAPEDAMLKLQERPTHNFLPFINIETNKVCVIYKLKDGKNYGIVEPEA